MARRCMRQPSLSFCLRLKHGEGVPSDDAEGERLIAEAVALGFDLEAARAASGQ
jgi:hypothetical protein